MLVVKFGIDFFKCMIIKERHDCKMADRLMIIESMFKKLLIQIETIKFTLLWIGKY